MFKSKKVLYRLAGAEREEIARLLREQVKVQAQLEALLKMIATREKIADAAGHFALDLDALAFVKAPVAPKPAAAP